MKQIVISALVVACATNLCAVTLSDVIAGEDIAVSHSGNASWYGTSLDGCSALRSGKIGHSQSSGLSIEFDAGGDGLVIFDCRVSSESGRDLLRFFVDGQETLRISGSEGRTSTGCNLMPGKHVLSWVYSKDGSVDHGDDCAWIWNVKLPTFKPDPRSGFLKNVFKGQAYDFSSAIVKNVDSTEVVFPEEMYCRNSDSFPTTTTYAYQTFMYMEGGVTYYFRGYTDDYTFVKVDDYEVISVNAGCCESRGDICFEESGWHKLDLRVANNGGPGGYSSGYDYGGIQYSTEINSGWKNFCASSDGSQFLLENPTPQKSYTLVSRRPYNYTIQNGVLSIRNLVKGETEIEIPASIAGLPVTEVAASAFLNQTGLTKVVLPDTIKTIGSSAFQGCAALRSVTLSASLETIGDNAFNGCVLLADVALPSGLKTIGGSAFNGCASLSSVNLPDSIVQLGGSAFRSCTSLVHFRFPREMDITPDACLMGCSSLTDVVLPENLSTLNSSTLRQCSSLKTIALPDSLRTIGSYAFSECRALSEVVLPPYLQMLGSFAFHSCESLQHIKIPESVTRIDERVFQYCKALKEMHFPPYVSVLGDAVLEGCNELVKANYPPLVTTIGNYMFQYCYKLEEFEIPNNITFIGQQAFRQCNSLRKIIIPSSVLSVGKSAFNECANLQYAEYKGELPTGWKDSTFNCQVVFPRDCGAEWIAAFGINNFRGFFNSGVRTVKVVSSKIRENDPTIMDVVYRVESSKSKVKVRVLAFEDGERSFAKVVRPETFVEGTGVYVGDNVTPNEEHTISWRVSSDWQTKLAKVKFEVLAMEGGLVPLELMTIPESDQYGKMKISWNAISDNQWFDALLWLYADKDPGLTLNNGQLSGGGLILANGAGLYCNQWYQSGYGYHYDYTVHKYVYPKMGYSVLEGAALDYANKETRLGLAPDRARQYAYKIVP